MKKEDKETLMEALQSSLNLREWDIRRDGETWSLASKSDERKLQLPVQELAERLQGLERSEEKAEEIEAFVSRVLQALPATSQSTNIREQQERLFPVVRSASFPAGKTPGKRLIKRAHTAETTIFYALDFGNSYALVNEEMVAESKLSEDEVHQWALHNVKQLPNEPRMDYVGDNRFYFFSQDEYAASRVLNDKLLSDMRRRIKGEMVIALPHQEAFIIADLQNAAGYNTMGQMTMKFYGEGNNPITPLPMEVEENGEFTPILVMPDAIKQKKTFKK